MSEMIPGKELARLLDVSPAALSKAAHLGHKCAELPVSEYTVRSESGRITGYRVPAVVLAALKDKSAHFPAIETQISEKTSQERPIDNQGLGNTMLHLRPIQAPIVPTFVSLAQESAPILKNGSAPALHGEQTNQPDEAARRAQREHFYDLLADFIVLYAPIAYRVVKEKLSNKPPNKPLQSRN